MVKKKDAVATDAETPIEIASYMSVDVTVVKTDSDVDGIIKTTTDVNNKDDQNKYCKSKDYRWYTCI